MNTLITRIAAALLAIPLLASTPALAKPLYPDGSYLQTCTNIQVDGDSRYLAAYCKRRDGSLKYSALHWPQGCLSGPTNVDGQMYCKRTRGLPKGSFVHSCDSFWINGATLYARCKTGRNMGFDQGHTALGNFRQCKTPVRNFYGNLDCLTKAKSLLPEGSYFETCFGIEEKNSVLTARCRTRTGGFMKARLDNTFACEGPVHNNNGKLECRKKDYGQQWDKLKTATADKRRIDPARTRARLGN